MHEALANGQQEEIRQAKKHYNVENKYRGNDLPIRKPNELDLGKPLMMAITQGLQRVLKMDIKQHTRVNPKWL